MTATFDSFAQGWAGPAGPFLFILVAGMLATEVWRWFGVIAGNRLSEDSEVLNWGRAVATALIAGVIGNLLLFPEGALANVPLALRLSAAAIGWIVFVGARRNVLAGVVAAETVLVAGLFVLPG